MNAQTKPAHLVELDALFDGLREQVNAARAALQARHERRNLDAAQGFRRLANAYRMAYGRADARAIHAHAQARRRIAYIRQLRADHLESRT